MSGKNKVIDSAEFKAGGPLDFVETGTKTYYFDPPIPCEVGEWYRIELLESGVRLWKLIVDSDVVTEHSQ